jgi:insertion element IS1 protein InsB
MSGRVCAGFNASLVSAHKPWLIGSKKDERNPALKATLAPAQPEDILELDEAWSFVLSKAEKCWLWTAMCRRTRQIVAFVIGDRSEATCRLLWQAIPDEYKPCQTYSDLWEAYVNVFPQETHHSVGKESGQTNHMERWNNTLRQWNARYVRKRLSFSKTDFFHSLVTRLFIVRYNLNKLSLVT